jgi:hypothetical protein
VLGFVIVGALILIAGLILLSSRINSSVAVEARLDPASEGSS